MHVTFAFTNKRITILEPFPAIDKTKNISLPPWLSVEFSCLSPVSGFVVTIRLEKSDKIFYNWTWLGQNKI